MHPTSHLLQKNNDARNQMQAPTYEKIKVNTYCWHPHLEPCIQGNNVINMCTGSGILFSDFYTLS